jgi:hypothetical protein
MFGDTFLRKILSLKANRNQNGENCVMKFMIILYAQNIEVIR